MPIRMRRVITIAFALAVVSCAAAAADNSPPIWPYPSKFSSGTTNLPVESINFKFSSNQAPSDCQDIYDAFSRFAPVFFPHSQPRKPFALPHSDSMLTGVSVSILNCSVPLQLGIDESYSLTIDSSGGYSTNTLRCFALSFPFSFPYCHSIIACNTPSFPSETHKSPRQPYTEPTTPCRP